MNLYFNEYAIVYDNGNRNMYTVNFALMNTKLYHDRFENLTKRKNVNETLYKQAIELLGRRSGTEYEELIIIDARTGDFLFRNASAVDTRAFQCGLSQKQSDYLESLGKFYEALHNHPNSSFPSPSDVINLFVRELQKGSTIVCHNGTIYRLEKLKQFYKIQELANIVKREVQADYMGHPEHLIEKNISLRIIEKLQRKNVLNFKEVP